MPGKFVSNRALVQFKTGDHSKMSYFPWYTQETILKTCPQWLYGTNTVLALLTTHNERHIILRKILICDIILFSEKRERAHEGSSHKQREQSSGCTCKAVQCKLVFYIRQKHLLRVHVHISPHNSLTGQPSEQHFYILSYLPMSSFFFLAQLPFMDEMHLDFDDN